MLPSKEETIILLSSFVFFIFFTDCVTDELFTTVFCECLEYIRIKFLHSFTSVIK